MKRLPAFVGLSQDHHTALVLARRCIDGKTTWEAVKEAFEKELEPHFQIEERLVLPVLGEDPLANRTLVDHARLRALVEEAGPLAEFGEKLQQHIRFEERELFERTQKIMSAEQLEALHQAWPKANER